MHVGRTKPTSCRLVHGLLTSFKPPHRAYASLSLPLSLTRPRRASRATLTPLKWHCVTSVRGAKQKATVVLDELPVIQGVIDGPPLPPQDDEPDYPPLLQQVRNSMLKFSHCVLLTRVGGFYEVNIVSRNRCMADL